MNHARNTSLVLAIATACASAHPGHNAESVTTSAAIGAAQPEGFEPMAPIDLPDPVVTITIEGEQRVIRSNGLPDHATGAFPNDGNPNAIRPQTHEIRLPINPVVSETLTPSRPEFGIALNGVIFDAGTGEFWSADGQRFGRPSAWNYEAIGGSVDLGLDTNNAHVQPTGKYHYHGLSDALVKSRAVQAESSGMTLIGWAFDGFPVYAPYGHVGDAESQVIPLKSSYRLKEGTRPETPEGPGGAYDGSFGADWEYVEGLGDLDEYNGRLGVTPEFPEGTYYYAVTKSYPYIPRFWRGEVSAEFKKGPGGGPGANGPGTGQGPPDRRGERPQRRPNP